MTNNHLSTFLSRKGQIVSVSWSSAIKTPKGSNVNVQKHVTTQARAGVNYDNMKDVIAKRESGELPAENAGLPWGKWATLGGVSLFPHVIAHTPKGETEEKHYLRFATLPGARMDVTYSIDGKPATKAEAQAVTLASAWSEDKVRDVFTVTASNIHAIN